VSDVLDLSSWHLGRRFRLVWRVDSGVRCTRLARGGYGARV